MVHPNFYPSDGRLTREQEESMQRNRKWYADREGCIDADYVEITDNKQIEQPSKSVEE